MPLIKESTYKRAPRYQFNGHLQTVLPDGDFVDLDWVDNRSRNLVLLSHGLEGNSERHYMMGMANRFSEEGWDVLAWNCRSCSGEMNRKFRLYNHGEIGDIGEVIGHALQTKDYEKVLLVGFSMGGSILMKYLGVHGNKAADFPGRLDISKLDEVGHWRDFDEHYSAPLGGYEDAADFYRQASAKNFMGGTDRPILLVNAGNDPILPPACSPAELCKDHPKLFLERPESGGHVGFTLPGKPYAWSEYRAIQFLQDHLN